jgi:pyrroloquinoline quinone (PQQ) biosynthesis protein C
MTTRLSPTEFRNAVYDMCGERWWNRQSPLFDFLNDHFSVEGARIFAEEHCVFANRFPRWSGNIIGNCPVIEARRNRIANLFQEEVHDPTIDQGHYDSMVAFAVSLGADREKVMAYQGTTHTIMAVAYWDWVSRAKPWLEALTAIGVLELLCSIEIANRYGAIPLNDPRTWESLQDLMPEGQQVDMSHWVAAEIADGPEGGHGDQALEIVIKYADTAEKQQACLDALAESIDVFNLQYDMIGRRALEASKLLGRVGSAYARQRKLADTGAIGRASHGD